VLEAMACGIPAAATAWGGPADYIDYSCGILVPASNPQTITQGFVDAMRSLVADPEMRLKLGSSGRRRVEQLYDWEQKVDRILELYGKAIHDFQRN